MQGLGQGIAAGQTVVTTTETVLSFGATFGQETGGNVTLGGGLWGQQGGGSPQVATVWVIVSIPFTPGTGTTSVTVRLYTQNSVRDSVVIPVTAGVATTLTSLMRDATGLLATTPPSTGTPGGTVTVSVQQTGATGNGSTGTAEMICFTF